MHAEYSFKRQNMSERKKKLKSCAQRDVSRTRNWRLPWKPRLMMEP